MKIALYFDEDLQESDLIQALRLREADVLSSAEAGMNGRTDEEQLEFASSQNYDLYSHNTRDFYQLHTQFLTQGKSHAELFLGHNSNPDFFSQKISSAFLPILFATRFQSA